MTTEKRRFKIDRKNRQVLQEEVDDTIGTICEWVQSNLKQTSSIDQSMMVPEMIKALAELISARSR